MNNTSIEATEALAPILMAARAKRPNWEKVAQQLMQYLDEREPNWQRVADILDVLQDGNFKNLEDIAAATGLSIHAVRQTVAALERGGFKFRVETAANTVGRPSKFVALP